MKIEDGKRLKLLVIDDEAPNLRLIESALERRGVEILTTTNPEMGFELFQKQHPAIVFLDVMMPELNGMELLERIVASDPGAEVIMMTGYYTVESAVEAIRKGATDLLAKPLDVVALRNRISKLVSEGLRRQLVTQLDQQMVDTFQFEGIVGRSPLIMDVFSSIRKVAPHFRTVLITGDTGTGKELVARALHRLSPVANRTFAVCNCSALVETLLESELFGHVRGAFTGATQDKLGLFEYANQGTVFLDEIGDMPLAAQAKLLRVLQSQEVQRVGSPACRKLDLHVIAATNRDLRALMQAHKFREDLYYRLSMVEIALPRLADRKEDMPLLQRYFVQQFAAQYKKSISGITRRAQTLLARHDWPGNVRQLENVLGNACMMVEGSVIDAGDLPPYLLDATVFGRAPGDKLLSMKKLQEHHLLHVLNQVQGDKSRAAQVLGIARSTLYNMLAAMETSPSASGSARGQALRVLATPPSRQFSTHGRP